MSNFGTKKSLMKSSVSYEATASSPFRRGNKPRDRESIKPKTILQPARQAIVVFEGVDVTPISLNPYIFEGGKERQISLLDNLTKDSSFMAQHTVSKVDSQRFQNNLLAQKQEGERETVTLTQHKSIVTSAYFGDDIIIPAITTAGSRSDFNSQEIQEIDFDGEASEVFPQPSIPEQISLILTETETVSLLEMPSCTVPKTSELADLVEEDNQQYDYLTKGKGRNRRVLHVGVQTVPVLQKTRDTEIKKARCKHSSTYVSSWDMYDTFKKMELSEEESDGVASLSDDDNLDFGLKDHVLNDDASLESYRVPIEDKQLNKIIKSQAFQDALIVIERILGSNCYNAQQKRFKGLSDPDPLRENMEYAYRLDLLWTYANEETENKCVTAIAFNTSNEDIVAVAYGKYYYNDRDCSGMVMIWNFKNPQQPERQYDFVAAVTAIAFSEECPNLLAVGFYNGDLKILDVSKRELCVEREDLTFFESVWSISWFQQGDEEDLMVSYGDGRVCRYQITDAAKLKRTQIMVTAAAEGKLKGIVYLKKCEGTDISITGYDQARCLALHPIDPATYFVGTSEGVVHRCSTNYYNDHMDLFKAHVGAVHTIKFSPFANKLFVTCGDDFLARVWVDGVSDPLLRTTPSILPVLDVDWSPQHPTVIASVRGPDILVWDFQRKMYQSQSTTRNAKTTFNTVCRFTTNGRCLMVGDMVGNLHVYALEDMPIPPFFPDNLILYSLKKLLVTKPDLLKKLRKVGPLNFDRKRFSKYFN